MICYACKEEDSFEELEITGTAHCLRIVGRRDAVTTYNLYRCTACGTIRALTKKDRMYKENVRDDNSSRNP